MKLHSLRDLSGRSTTAMFASLFVIIVVGIPLGLKFLKMGGRLAQESAALEKRGGRITGGPYYFSVKLPGQKVKQVAYKKDPIVETYLGTGYTGTYEVKFIGEAFSPEFEVVFNYKADGKDRRESFKFGKKDFGKMRELKKSKEGIKFSMTTTGGPPTQVDIANLPSSEVPQVRDWIASMAPKIESHEMRPTTCTGPEATMKYVLMAHNGWQGPQQYPGVWVKEFDDMLEGTFQMGNGLMHYSITPGAKEGELALTVRLEMTFSYVNADKTPMVPEDYHFTLDRRKMCNWLDLGDAKRNLCCMILPKDEFNSQVRFKQAPVLTRTINEALAAAEAARKTQQFADHMKSGKVTNALIIKKQRELYDKMRVGEGNEFEMLGLVIAEGTPRQPDAQGTPLSYFNWRVKIRPRLFPDLTPGMPTMVGLEGGDHIYTYEGKQYGNFIVAALKAEKAAKALESRPTASTPIPAAP